MSASYFEAKTLAQAYYKFRPTPPASLLKRILDYVREGVPPATNGKWAKAVDVGCGSGQATQLLSEYFDSITGSDVSEAQILQAKANNKLQNVDYHVSPAETLDFPTGSVFLVTSGQAAHWFELPKFYAEVDRILAKGGVVAIYGYLIPRVVNHAKAKVLSEIITDIYSNKLAECWGPKINLLDAKYSDPAFLPPYPNVVRDDDLFVRRQTTVRDLCNYFTSWSGYNEYCTRHGLEEGKLLLKEFDERMLSEMGVSTAPENTPIEIEHPFFLVMARKPAN